MISRSIQCSLIMLLIWAYLTSVLSQFFVRRQNPALIGSVLPHESAFSKSVLHLFFSRIHQLFINFCVTLLHADLTMTKPSFLVQFMPTSREVSNFWMLKRRIWDFSFNLTYIGSRGRGYPVKTLFAWNSVFRGYDYENLPFGIAN